MRNVAPSDPQCRSDYEAHCASVPPGGGSVAAMPAEEHVEPLVRMPGCGARGRTAGRAQGGNRCPPLRPRPSLLLPPQRPSRPEPAAPAAAPEGGRKHTVPRSPATHRWPRSAARAAPTIRKSAPACRPEALRRCNAWKRTRQRSPAVCQQALNAASGDATTPPAGAAAATASPGAAPAAAAAPVLVLRPMRPREELFVLRSACGGDVRALCGGVAPGGGRIVQCLATQAASLSPACKDVLAQFAAQ